jgi:hypothetical protein
MALPRFTDYSAYQSTTSYRLVSTPRMGQASGEGTIQPAQIPRCFRIGCNCEPWTQALVCLWCCDYGVERWCFWRYEGLCA